MVSAYSVGKAKRQSIIDQFHSQIPGPSHYTPNPTIKHTPQFKIPTSQRETFKENQNPAPGHYLDVPIDKKKNKSPAYTIAGNYREDNLLQFKKSIPGPAQYNPKSYKGFGETNKGAHLIGRDYHENLPQQTKIILNNRKKSPGVGRYDVGKSSDACAPVKFSATIGRASRQSSQDIIIPGPGSYGNSQSVNSSLRAVSIGNELRFRDSEEQKQIQPGPGSYDIQRSQSQKGPSAYVIPRRKDFSVGSQGNPGPCSYSINMFNQKKTPHVVFARALRCSSVQEITPGPSCYEPSSIKKKSPKAIIGKQKRFDINDEIIPGPGHYDDTEITMSKAPSFSIVPRRNDLKAKLRLKNSPGVGKYTPQPTYVRSASFCIPKQKRECTDGNELKNLPGPGAYDLVRQSKTFGITIPRSGRDNNSRPTTPGPGSYNLKPMFNDVPGYLLKQN